MISHDDRREAESQIARLIYSYFYRLDERDLEAVAAFFEDAAWHISPERATHGKAEKLAWLRENTPAHDAYLGPHLIGNVLVDVTDDGRTATSLSYFIVSQLVDGPGIHVAARGRYADSFALRNGQWRFTERRVHVDRR
ncbi:nuclear transport factor 2 family protein [Rhizobium leguminosarum]|uniref:nuclear transport factor 2 family protein n=1 Tax=Rhizobium leguminosarum TaxID=384 RepID=UPI001C95C261|nr:nuclear transport factor 2 family protein [Rhizobium leguminosarum]MBY5766671.1 nuclear transport factor 2 family protein [Rhizobium leguminosarum]